jgi:hypothetical protein
MGQGRIGQIKLTVTALLFLRESTLASINAHSMQFQTQKL